MSVWKYTVLAIIYIYAYIRVYDIMQCCMVSSENLRLNQNTHASAYVCKNQEPQHTNIAGTHIFSSSNPDYLSSSLLGLPHWRLRVGRHSFFQLCFWKHICVHNGDPERAMDHVGHDVMRRGRLGRFRNGLGWTSWTIFYWKWLSNIIQPEVCTKKNYILTAWNKIFQTSVNTLISLISSLLPMEELV